MANAENEKISVSKSENYKVKIATDVIARIAGMAALDVDGVSAVAQNLGREAISKCNRQTLKSGARVSFAPGGADVTLALTMSYGYNIPEVCREVQKKVAYTITSMTGLSVLNVNVNAAGVRVASS